MTTEPDTFLVPLPLPGAADSRIELANKVRKLTFLAVSHGPNRGLEYSQLWAKVMKQLSLGDLETLCSYDLDLRANSLPQLVASVISGLIDAGSFTYGGGMRIRLHSDL